MITPIDFNGAEVQDTALAVSPSGTVARVRLTIRPGGAGPEGWLTQSRTSDALYLNTEAVILEGPYARRRIYTRVGIKGRAVNERGEDVYASRGRSLIRGILESARGVRTDDTSDQARAARTIRGFGDLNGLEPLVRVGVDRDRTNPGDEGRNVIAAALGPDHAEYARHMGGTTAAVATATASSAAPAWSASPAAAAATGAGNAPFWAR
jgi:hypothetical protein